MKMLFLLGLLIILNGCRENSVIKLAPVIPETDCGTFFSQVDNLWASVLTANSVSLKWVSNQPLDDIELEVCEGIYCVDQFFPAERRAVKKSQGFYDWGNLQEGKHYTFRMLSPFGFGENEIDWVQSETVFIFKGLDFIDSVTESSVKLNWISIPEARAYLIYSLRSEVLELLDTVPENQNFYISNGLNSSTSYTYVVRALSKFGSQDGNGKKVSVTTENFVPTDISGLEIWLKADSLTLSDGDGVAMWKDSSGNGNDYVQENINQEPIFKVNQVNGQPAVDADGSQFLHMDNPVMSGGTDFSIFLISKTDVVASNKNYFGFCGYGGVGTLMGFTPEYAVRDRYGFSKWSGAASTKDFEMVSLRKEGAKYSDMTLSVNGTEKGVAETTDTTLNYKACSLNALFARHLFNYTGLLDGQISEFLVFRPALSVYDQERVQCHLKNKYGLTVSHSCP